MRRLLLSSGFMLIVTATAFTTVVAEDLVSGLDVAYPREFSAIDLFRELALLNPESPIHGVLKSDREEVANVVRFQQEVLTAEAEHLDLMRDNLQKRMADFREMAQIQQAEIDSISGEAEAESGLPVVDEETTNLLLRNCVVELQRLQWEIASEKALAEQEISKPDSRVLEAELQAQKVQVESSRLQVDVLSKKLDRVLKAAEEGNAAAQGRASEIELNIEAERARCAREEAALVAAQMKLESLVLPAVSESAVRLAQLSAREKAVVQQVDQFKRQRAAHARVSRIRSDLKGQEVRASQVFEQIQEAELRKFESDSMLRNIRTALERYEATADEKKDAEAASPTK